MTQIFYIALFGALGVLARFAASIGLAFIGGFGPFAVLGSFVKYAGTVLINVLGSYLLGVVFSGRLDGFWAEKGWALLAGPSGRLILGVGFLGGFTTFSTFSLEALALLKAGSYGATALYVLASVGLGLLAAFWGLRG